jgi:hypothetical protein
MREDGCNLVAPTKRELAGARFGILHSMRLAICLLGLAGIAGPATAGPAFDTSTPASFFTNVASRLLSRQLNLNLYQIQIYPTNQYTPAVHRLLQVTANLWDAQNTNYYPTIFRPLFSIDAASNIFICGYLQVTNVAGTSDPQLAPPYAVAALGGMAGVSPIADANGPVNVYGVPWVIGAKAGLPNFNQMELLTAAQVTRKLEVSRTSLDPKTATYATNQAYIVGMTNQFGVTFWNSYSNTYPRQLQVVVSDYVSMLMTNGSGKNVWPLYAWNFYTNVSIPVWPGAAWGANRVQPPNETPQLTSFVRIDWPMVYLPPLVYDDVGQDFETASANFEPLKQLSQLSVTITNYLQAYILDGNEVIDYVQLSDPGIAGGINQALADLNYPQPNYVHYQWSTNSYSGDPNVTCGVINQLAVSGNPSLAPPAGGQWTTTPTPVGTTPSAEAAFFVGFFEPSFQYNGQTYVNRQSQIQAPYTPSRTVYASFLLQANDPLVHYNASDLNSQMGVQANWYNGRYYNGVWAHSDDPVNAPLPVTPLSPVGGRYQPWGNLGQMSGLGGPVDANPYNLAYKDPLVWSPDNWNFPTGQAWNLNWVGQVHRGTPWQTIYLKSTNILALTTAGFSSGLITWQAWTGDYQTGGQAGLFDANASAPVSDWQLVDSLAAMLNTNDLASRISINNPDPNAWAMELDGMTVLTNTATAPLPGALPQLSPLTISSNSAQAALIVTGILSAKTNFAEPSVVGIGEVLAAPQLSIQSPYLNLNLNTTRGSRLQYAINDQAYEAIPSQLLPLLRVDAVGRLVSTNGQMQAQFTGYDGHAYALQVSPDLSSWTSVDTNSPTEGEVDFMLPEQNHAAQFYRTLLIQ